MSENSENSQKIHLVLTLDGSKAREQEALQKIVETIAEKLPDSYLRTLLSSELWNYFVWRSDNDYPPDLYGEYQEAKAEAESARASAAAALHERSAHLLQTQQLKEDNHRNKTGWIEAQAEIGKLGARLRDAEERAENLESRAELTEVREGRAAELLKLATFYPHDRELIHKMFLHLGGAAASVSDFNQEAA